MITVPEGVKHRTRSNTRTLLLCFEHETNDVTGEN
jgi:mannose-6-phosphate isomerase-like protein (cupin superfamily)